MKIDLIDIGIKDLKDFILYSDNYLATSFRTFSTSSLRLRLQFLIFQSKFKRFDIFFDCYKKDVLLRQKIIDNVFPQANELFRDASCFDCFFNLLQQLQKKEMIEIAVFEFGNYSETISLLIFLKNKTYLNRVRITVVDLSTRNELPNVLEFVQKEIDTGEINYSVFNEKELLINFYRKTNKAYEFVLPTSEKIVHKKLSEIANIQIKFDSIISRNLTLHYNFHAHQNIFLSYVNFLRKDGILFVGTNENFEWCSGIEQLVKPDRTKPLYIKK